MRLFALLFLGVAPWLVSSCTSTAKKWQTSGVYSGIYEIGFEKNDFFPDDSRERWSLEGSIDDLRRRMTGPGRFNEPALGNRVYVVVEGDLSKPGHYGHNGGYRRELSVTRVIEARNAYSHLR